MRAGRYEPLELHQAVERCKEITYFFNSKKIDVIRIGLQTTDTICSPSKESSEVVAGPYHETFRQLVESAICYDSLVEKIKNLNTNVKEVEITVNPKNVNNVIGYKKENIIKLKEMYDVDVQIVQDENCPVSKFNIKVLRKFKDFKDDED